MHYQNERTKERNKKDFLPIVERIQADTREY